MRRGPSAPARSRWRGAPWVALGLLISAGALGETADSAQWDGFTRWVQALRAAGYTVEAPDRLDLTAVPPGAGLALLDPAAGDFEGLQLFVQEGGRVLLAVESPDAEPLIAAFGLRFAPVPPAAADEGHPALRPLRAPGAGVFAGVADVLTNRPAALAGPLHLDPAVAYEDGTPFAYHPELGEGELVVLADASPLINLMLDGADNARLAGNLGAWLARDGAAPIRFAGPTTTVSGRYGGEGGGGGALAGLNRALADLGRILDPDDLILHLLLAMAIAGTLVFAVAVFPGGGPPVTDGPVVPPPGRAEHLAGRPTGPAAPEPPPPSDPPATETRAA